MKSASVLVVILFGVSLGISATYGQGGYGQGGGGVITPATPPAPPAFNVPEGSEVVLYNGDAKANPLGLSLKAWGNGECTEVSDYHYRGPKCLKVKTRGLYEGARLEFENGPTITPDTEGAYLVFQMILTETTQKKKTGGIVLPGIGEAGGLGEAGDMGPMGGMGAMAPGRPGTARPGTTTKGLKTEKEKEEKKLSYLRILATFEKGLLAAERYPLIVSFSDDEGWSAVAIPLSAFKGKGPVEGRLRRLVICGDEDQDVYIGRASIVTDKSPMKAEIRTSRGEGTDTEIGKGQEVDLQINLDVGLSAVSVTWAFGDGGEATAETTGLRVTHTYARPGVYPVKATVKDLANQKAPYVATFTVNARG